MLDPKTLYRYIAAGFFCATNFDLLRKVTMRPRRKKPGIKIDKGCYVGRAYKDYVCFIKDNPDKSAVQMDSVIGAKGSGQKVLLTLIFPHTALMLAFLRDANTASSVTNIFNDLYETLGRKTFMKLFPMVLTDRGSEFTNPKALEFDSKGRRRTQIFFCNPYASYEKPEVENNHTFIRRISPKGKSFNNRTQNDIDLMMNHINSYRRESLGGQSPAEVFISLFGTVIAEKLGIKIIPADDITLTPELFNN
jgi:IS30 family transposase